MRRISGFLAAVALAATPLLADSAPTAEEILAKYVAKIGGMEKIEAIKTLRQSGKFIGGGGFEAKISQENKRPDLVRQEFVIQGLVGVNAYDGKTGWKIEPWEGNKNAQPMGEEELKEIIEQSDFDGPLVRYKEKGNTVEYVGTEPVEGTDAYKLKVTLKNGDVQYYFMDTDYFVPIKIERKRMVRGAEQESETSLGDYKEVDGVYFPYSQESGAKGSQNRSKIVIEKIEANVPISDKDFVQPAVAGAAASKPPAQGEGSK